MRPVFLKICERFMQEKRFVNTAHIIKSQAPKKVPATVKKCLSTVFDVSETAAEAIAKKSSISYTQAHEIRKSVKVLRDFGIVESDLLANARILTLKSSLLKQRHACLTEIGFVKIGAPELLQYRFILACTTVAIKSKKLLPDSVDPFTNLTNALEMEKSFVDSVREQLSGSPDSVAIHELRHVILEEYLAQRLQFGRKVAQETCFLYSSIRSLSMQQLKQLISILLEDFGFDGTFLKENRVLFNCLPEQLNALLTRSSSCGLDIRRLAMKSARVLLIDVNRLLTIYQLLKDFNIPDDVLVKFPLIFQLNPPVLRQRLSAMDANPDFQQLKSHNRYLLAVYRYPKVLERMNKLKDFGFTADLSLSALCHSESMFNDFVQKQVEMSEWLPCLHFLMAKFEMPVKTIEAMLRKHPKHKHITLVNTKMVLTYLYKLGLSQKQIFTGLQVVCYDAKLVMKVWDAIQDHPDIKPFNMWLRNENVIQLLIYFLEKEMKVQN